MRIKLIDNNLCKTVKCSQRDYLLYTPYAEILLADRKPLENGETLNLFRDKRVLLFNRFKTLSLMPVLYKPVDGKADVGRLYDAMRKRGYQVVSEPESLGDGTYKTTAVLYVSTVAGEIIELLQKKGYTFNYKNETLFHNGRRVVLTDRGIEMW